MRWLKKNGVTLGLLFVALAGVGLIAYPAFSDWWNSFHQSRAVASYMDAVTDLNTDEYDKIIKSAENYNRRLIKSGLKWNLTDEEKKAYLAELNVNDSGIMGYIDIPKIRITLPIYHGTDDAVLQIAIGHLEGTSLPVGGSTTHCVVSGHRGLPSARLFTDLDKIVDGDTFTMTVLNRTVTYEIDQVRIVEPTDLSDLQLEKGKDYCTLVTCTPYGINTHRLLVRGHRIENAQGDAQVIADAILIESIFIAPFIGAPVLALLVIIMLVTTSASRRRNQNSKQALEEYGVEREYEELMIIEIE